MVPEHFPGKLVQRDGFIVIFRGIGIGANTPMEGLCDVSCAGCRLFNIFGREATDIHSCIMSIMWSWSKYSGNMLFPVPVPEKMKRHMAFRTARERGTLVGVDHYIAGTIYHSYLNSSLGLYAEEYGALRRELAAYIADTLEKLPCLMR